RDLRRTCTLEGLLRTLSVPALVTEQGALILRFSVLGHGGHVGVLSFPTRRSSDLQGSGPCTARGDLLRGLSPRPRCTGRACSGRDRKSTRLNSSHGSISYAVFCLKKKINPIA